MKLSEVLQGISNIESANDFDVEGLSYDSRLVKKNHLFVAVKGLQADGHLFLKQAYDNGACAALVEAINPELALAQIKINDTRSSLAKAAANYYSHPSNDFHLIGITGTNGKTTTGFMLESIFEAAKQKTGLVGTVRCSIGGDECLSNHTTPESLDLQSIFNDMRKAKVNTAVVEVSSHAIDLHRVDCCSFNQLIFTNLTQDHLDYHKNFENYFQAKSTVFKNNKQAAHIINIDDDYGKKLSSLSKAAKKITFGFNQGADFWAQNININDYSSTFTLNYLGHSYNFEILQGGAFNIYNALGAIAAAVNLGIEPEIIQLGLFNLTAVPGRFEILPLGTPFKVIIDYAHTPDGLENLLKSARQVTKGRLITLFGCGGERDRGKRPKMGKIAAALSDTAIVTSDNPRGEDPAAIIEEVVAVDGHFVAELDRRKAIRKAFEIAGDNDTVVIAGKGHESTQEINGCHLPFKDQEVAAQIWQDLKKVK